MRDDSNSPLALAGGDDGCGGGAGWDLGGECGRADDYVTELPFSLALRFFKPAANAWRRLADTIPPLSHLTHYMLCLCGGGGGRE